MTSAGDTYYLDEPRVNAWRHRRKVRVMVMLLIVALTAICVFVVL